jgi:hypothetical protein
MTLTDTDKTLDETDKIILWAYHGGVTEDKALQRTEGKPGVRQHRRRRKRLQRLGYLRDLQEGKHGPGKHVFQPTEEIPFFEKRGPEKELLQATKEERIEPKPVKLSPEHVALIKAGVQCYMGVMTVRSSINYKDAWRKPRRVRTICRKEILPLVDDIRELRSKGVKVTLPWQFFEKENPPHFKSIFRSPDLRGPLKILLHKPLGECCWIRPSLPEWKEYLQKLADELKVFPEIHSSAVLAGVWSGGQIPNYYVVVPSRIVD